ncbi:hypothetical protein M8494_23975 [Serratia ureilytica]
MNIWVLPGFRRAGALRHYSCRAMNRQQRAGKPAGRGCHFLLFDQRPLAADPAIRSWLCGIDQPHFAAGHAGPALPALLVAGVRPAAALAP